jgi:hypothetical protein
MTLNDIVQSAQGGQAVDNLAQQFGLSHEATQAAVEAMVPAFSTGLQSMAANPAAIGAVLTELASGAHVGSFADPAQAAGASAIGTNVLGQVFGSPQGIDEVVRHVSEVSGVSAATIQGMLPVVASLLMGGLAQSMASQGLSGVLGGLANAASAPGGLSPAVAPAGGSGGVFGSFIGSLFGGGSHATTPESAALVAGFAALSAMFVSGVQVAQAHQAGLNAIVQSFMRPPPGGGP